MTKTAEVADVLLPATSWGEHAGVFTCADRGFQRFGKAIEASGNVKRDWEIISLLATEMGYPMHYEDNQQIWDEMRELCPLFYGVTYEKWARWAMCSGLAHPSIIPAPPTCTRIISSTPLLAKDSYLPPLARPGGDTGCGLPAGTVHGARSGSLLLSLNDRELRGAAKPGRRAGPGANEPGRCG